jgi:cysteine-S-conjugate beta-lyase
MKYSFDTIIPRDNTNCYKYDLREKIFGNKDVIPLWVADMDFKIADDIIDDISTAVQHGIYGYTFYHDSLYQSLINWNSKRNNWIFTKKDIYFYHGVVPSINLIIQEFSNPGDKIIVQTPVYFPFFQSTENHNRIVLNNQLKIVNGKYTMDFEALEKSIDSSTKIMILCHPHNPVGRCWNRDELIQLHAICKKHNILVISDEIHSDLLLNNNKHIPWATLSSWAEQNSITLVAPSKTFNIAGLSISAIVTQNKNYQKKISDFITKNQLHGMSPLNKVAFESAYTKGELWLQELLEYLETNLNLIREFTINNPQLTLIEPEATYLAWIDCSKLTMKDSELHTFFIEKANVGLSQGIQFGKGGEGFMRLNYACPKSILIQALKNIEIALKSL